MSQIWRTRNMAWANIVIVWTQVKSPAQNPIEDRIGSACGMQ